MNFSLKQRIIIPQLIIIFFLLIVSLFSYRNLNLLGSIVNNLAASSSATLSSATDLANNISNVQFAVSNFFNEAGSDNFQKAIQSLKTIKTMAQIQNNPNIVKTVNGLEKKTRAAKIRFASLTRQNQEFINTQRKVQELSAQDEQKAGAILDIMTMAGSDMRSPKAANQKTIEADFAKFVNPLPKGKLKFALEDYWDAWAGYTAVYLKLRQDTNKVLNHTLNTLYNFQAHEVKKAKSGMAQTRAKAILKIRHSNLLLIITSVTALLLGFIISFLLGHGLFITVKKIAGGLSDSYLEVDNAAGSLTAASQEIAEAASSQAASLEEITGSLEEVTSMARRSADNAQQAESLMKNTQSAIGEGSESMQNLITAMNSISSSNEETQNIIKEIEQIAFQTNLLALNAAVEAARAGEAGAGFAVVADEVRNLAGRSSKAAGGTNDIISSSTTKIGKGSTMVEHTAQAYEEIAENSGQIAHMVAEIAVTAGEQASGIEKIKEAIIHLDETGQRNAASSEELAAAAETMQGQANILRNFVHDLINLIGQTDQTPESNSTPETIEQSALSAPSADNTKLIN
ncbi:methyl-accepting chemotaxis protein [Desulfobacterota bacterium M19]